MISRKRILVVSLGVVALLLVAGYKLNSPSSSEELTSNSSSQARASSAEDILSRLNKEGPFKWDTPWWIDDLKKWGVIALYGNKLDSSCVVFVFNDVKSAQRVEDDGINIWEAAGSSGEWVGKDSASDLGIIFIAESLDAACSKAVIKVLNWKRTSPSGFD